MNRNRGRIVPAFPWLLSLGLVVTGVAISGCGAGATAPPDASGNGESVGVASTPRGVGPSDPADSSVNPGAVSAEAPTGKPGPASQLASAPASPVGRAEVKTPAPAPVTPSAEQLARWAISEEPPLEMLACHDGFADPGVHCMVIAPDGQEFFLGGAKITLWRPSTSEPVADLLADVASGEVERPILAIAISPDGRWLAAGDSKGKLRIWDRSDRKQVTAVEAHSGRLTEIAFSPDSTKLATTSYSGEVRLWDTGGKKLKSLKIDSQEIRSLMFCTDSLLATAGREAAVWNLETGEKIATLTTDRLIGPALGLSADRRWLAFADSDAKTKLWDVEKKKVTSDILHTAAHRIEFSKDGRRIATTSGDGTIRIWDGPTRTIRQVIDADGDRTAAFGWLRDSDSLVVATESGRVRIWGTPEGAKSLGLERPAAPAIRATPTTAKRSGSPAEFDRVIDVRSFPRLPGSVPVWSYDGSETYNTAAPQEEIELFYRHVLGKQGWIEEGGIADPMRPGLNFQKEGCGLNVSVAPASSPTSDRDERQVTLRFAGNYDARWLPKVLGNESPLAFGSLSMRMWRSNASITDLEVALLRQFREAGWVPYSRLATSHTEDPDSRSFSMLQGGSVMTVSIGKPSDAPGELFVQVGVNVSRKALPLPRDASWIEFDSSTDLRLVAVTKMSLTETVAFFDTETPQEGWLGREAGRKVDEKRGRLPYIRGQRDVLIRLTALPDGKEGDGEESGEMTGTRILVGDAERTSWQLKPKPPVKGGAEKSGIEAADFALPKGADKIRFDADGKQIEYELTEAPPKVAEQFVKQMEELGWKRDGAGVLDDEYVFVTCKKEKAEIQLRGRGNADKAAVMISGDGLLWTKPLPAPPVRISYETWLRRSGKTASLEYLDEFAAEMQKLPANTVSAGQ